MNIMDILKIDPKSFLKECSECHGSGWVQTEYGEELSRVYRELLEAGHNEITAFERSHKHMDEKYGYDWREEGEEEYCSACRGKGEVLSKELKPLIELLKMIKKYEVEE